MSAEQGHESTAADTGPALQLVAPPLQASAPSSSGWVSVREVDDRTFFELDEDDELSSEQSSFLSALRESLEDRLRPYCVDLQPDRLLLALDVDAPDVALVNVGLELRGNELRGDRISPHDRTFPDHPTPHGFLVTGPPGDLAARGAGLLKTFASRPMVRHEWLHRDRVYATCYLFADTGERLAQSYESDLAPQGQEARLVEAGFVHGKGWIQTRGLGEPDRVVNLWGELPQDGAGE